MSRYKITTGSVTYAIKAKDILKRNGIRSYVERSVNNQSQKGCNYVVIAEGNSLNIQNILNRNGVKFNEITEF